MINLFAAIMAAFTGSALATYIGGRMYLDEAPETAAFPHIVFSTIGGSNENSFTEYLDDVGIQFSLYSTSKGATEIATMYADLKTVYDDARLSITSNTCIWCVRSGPPVTMVDEITTPTGTSTVKHWAVDYSVMMQKN